MCYLTQQACGDQAVYQFISVQRPVFKTFDNDTSEEKGNIQYRNMDINFACTISNVLKCCATEQKTSSMCFTNKHTGFFVDRETTDVYKGKCRFNR